MVSREKLYDAFGELIYAIANCDGIIQDEELKALEERLENYPGAREIKWSFDYEKSRKHSVEESYDKAIDICKENGPDAEYVFLLDVLEEVSRSNGIEEKQREIISRFQHDLRTRFLKDAEQGRLT